MFCTLKEAMPKILWKAVWGLAEYWISVIIVEGRVGVLPCILRAPTLTFGVLLGPIGKFNIHLEMGNVACRLASLHIRLEGSMYHPLIPNIPGHLLSLHSGEEGECTVAVKLNRESALRVPPLTDVDTVPNGICEYRYVSERIGRYPQKSYS